MNDATKVTHVKNTPVWRELYEALKVLKANRLHELDGLASGNAGDD